ASSRFQTANGEKFATLVAIPRHHLARLEEALRAARLVPVSFTLASCALQDPSDRSSDNALALFASNHSLALKAVCNGGIAALRTLDSGIETEGAHKKIDADFLAREIRITLGQMPGPIRESLRTIKIVGPSSITQKLSSDLSSRVKSSNVSVEAV